MTTEKRQTVQRGFWQSCHAEVRVVLLLKQVNYCIAFLEILYFIIHSKMAYLNIFDRGDFACDRRCLAVLQPYSKWPAGLVLNA